MPSLLFRTTPLHLQKKKIHLREIICKYRNLSQNMHSEEVPTKKKKSEISPKTFVRKNLPDHAWSDLDKPCSGKIREESTIAHRIPFAASSCPRWKIAEKALQDADSAASLPDMFIRHKLCGILRQLHTQNRVLLQNLTPQAGCMLLARRYQRNKN
jgi:hypothetical protein